MLGYRQILVPETMTFGPLKSRGAQRSRLFLRVLAYYKRIYVTQNSQMEHRAKYGAQGKVWGEGLGLPCLLFGDMYHSAQIFPYSLT